jgi:hypothetical protein
LCARGIDAGKRGAFLRFEPPENIRIPAGDDVRAVGGLLGGNEALLARLAELRGVDAVAGDIAIGGDVGQAFCPGAAGTGTRGVSIRAAASARLGALAKAASDRAL